jgi:hypothetical protein
MKMGGSGVSGHLTSEPSRYRFQMRMRPNCGTEATFRRKLIGQLRFGISDLHSCKQICGATIPINISESLSRPSSASTAPHCTD